MRRITEEKRSLFRLMSGLLWLATVTEAVGRGSIGCDEVHVRNQSLLPTSFSQLLGRARISLEALYHVKERVKTKNK